MRQTEHQHEAHDGESHDHLTHIQDYRKETVYVHHLPVPELITGIGTSDLKIKTSSPQTQAFFSQGVSLLHCFWDFEAYRSFKEAIRHDSTAVMPYWGLYSAIGAIEGADFEADKKLAVRQLKTLKVTASEHEKLCAEGILLRDADSETGKSGYQKKLELIVHKYPEDVDAKLESPYLKEFKGIDTYPISSDWRIKAKFLPTAGKKISITDITGRVSEQDSPGKLVFTVNGKEYSLDATGTVAGLHFVFADQTNKHETYGGDRFLDAPGPDADGYTYLDFNKATNPRCAFTPYTTCPTPPKENKLAVAISAGEKRYGDH